MTNGDHVETTLFPDLFLTSKFARKAQRVGWKQVPLLSLLASVVPCQWSPVNSFSCSPLFATNVRNEGRCRRCTRLLASFTRSVDEGPTSVTLWTITDLNRLVQTKPTIMRATSSSSVDFFKFWDDRLQDLWIRFLASTSNLAVNNREFSLAVNCALPQN